MAFKIQTINQSTPHSADHLQLQMLPLLNKIIKISGFIVNFFVSFVSLVSSGFVGFVHSFLKMVETEAAAAGGSGY